MRFALFISEKRKLTNTVVYANESEHNPQQASLKTRAGYGPKNRSSLAAYVRTRDVLTY